MVDLGHNEVDSTARVISCVVFDGERTSVTFSAYCTSKTAESLQAKIELDKERVL